MIEVDEHGNSAVIHFACVECGCKFHAYLADTFFCVGEAFVQLPGMRSRNGGKERC